MRYFAAFTATALISSAFVPAAHAQSTEEVLGAVLGGSAGAVVGGEVGDGSDESKVIGAVIGGSLGHVIGGELERDRERELRRRYADRPGEYYTYDGKAYRRYDDPNYGHVSFPIYGDDPYYYRDGRKKEHPVFARHPGKGKGKGLYKNR